VRPALLLGLMLGGCEPADSDSETDVSVDSDTGSAGCAEVCTAGGCELSMTVPEDAVTADLAVGPFRTVTLEFRDPAVPAARCSECALVRTFDLGESLIHAVPGQDWDVHLRVAGTRFELAKGWSVDDGPWPSLRLESFAVVGHGWDVLEDLDARIEGDGFELTLAPGTTEAAFPPGPAFVVVAELGLRRSITLSPPQVDVGLDPVDVPVIIESSGSEPDQLVVFARGAGSSAPGVALPLVDSETGPMVQLPRGRWELAFDASYEMDPVVVDIDGSPDPVELVLHAVEQDLRLGEAVDGVGELQLELTAPGGQDTVYVLGKSGPGQTFRLVAPAGRWGLRARQVWAATALGELNLSEGDPIDVPIPALEELLVEIDPALWVDGERDGSAGRWATVIRTETGDRELLRDSPLIAVPPGEYEVSGGMQASERGRDRWLLTFADPPVQVPPIEPKPAFEARTLGLDIRRGETGAQLFASGWLVTDGPGLRLVGLRSEQSEGAAPVGDVSAMFEVDGDDSFIGVIRPDPCLRIAPP